jgi:hypothetical protein
LPVVTSSDTNRPGLEPLARILSHEVNVADLLGYLVELDPRPLLAALGLQARDPGIRQEVRKGRRTRVDALITDAGDPIALVELKVGAAQHGDQFARYAAVAADLGGIPCHLIALDPFTADVPTDWGHHLLPDLLGGWAGSPVEPARVVATELEHAARGLLLQAAGPLARAGRAAVAVAVRHIDHAVRQAVPDLTLSGGPERTGGGQPMVVYWLPHPGRTSDREWLCVDLRSESARTSPWKLRLGVEVDDSEEGGASAESRSHDLAMELLESLRTSALSQSLNKNGHGQLARALSSRPDGFRGTPDGTDVQWPVATCTDQEVKRGQRRPAHPLLHHDYGRRLTAVSHVDCSALTAAEIAALVAYALRYLHAAAAR